MTEYDNRSVRPRDEQLDDLLHLKASELVLAGGQFIELATIFKREFPEEYEKSKSAISNTVRTLSNAAGDPQFAEAVLEILFGHDNKSNTD